MSSSIKIEALSNILSPYDYIEFALLFGSFAKAKANLLSDVDIGIFTNREISLLELGDLIAKFEKHLKKNVDIVILNELYKKNPTFCFEIVSNGKLIFCKDLEKFIEFKKKTYLYFFDTQYLRDMVNRAFKERLKSGKFGEIIPKPSKLCRMY